jgi:phosphotriesterase-related protein
MVPEREGRTSSTIETVLGPVDPGLVGLALAHEHLFVDLLGPAHPGYGRVDWGSVTATCVQRLAELREVGVDLLLDCTPIGIGRNVRLLREVSQRTGVGVACATGIYKGFVPPELADATAGRLAELFIEELTTGIDGTEVRAGFIKLATTEHGPTARERDVHRAGAIAGAATGSSIVLHSPQVETTRTILAALEGEGFDPARLVWAHAQDSTVEANLELASRGVTISLDAIGVGDDAEALDRIERLVGAGHEDRVLVSTDTSIWVHPPEMAYERSIEHLLGTFLSLVEARLGTDRLHRLVRGNVVRVLQLAREPTTLADASAVSMKE